MICRVPSAFSLIAFVAQNLKIPLIKPQPPKTRQWLDVVDAKPCAVAMVVGRRCGAAAFATTSTL